MLNLENKDYDLNTLFSFEVLKEILLKLARGQINLEQKVENIINNYQNKTNSKNKEDDDDDFNYFETDENFDLLEKDLKLSEEDKNESDLGNKDIKLKEKKEQFEIINNKQNNVDSGNKEKESKEEKKNGVKEENNNKEKEENKNKEKDDNKNKEKEYNKNKENEENKIGKKEENIKEEKEKTVNEKNEVEENNKEKDDNKEEKEINEENNEDDNKKGEISSALIKKIIKMIKKNKERISILEKENNHLKNKLKSHDSNGKIDLNSIEKKLNDIVNKLIEYEAKFENLEVKCTDIDVLNMIKDSGDGKIDATKAMLKSLEQKVFKKIEIIENNNRVPINSYLNEKMELVLSKIEKDRNNIEKLFDLSSKNKELIDELKTDLHDKTKEISRINDEGIKNLNKKLKDAREKLTQKIEEITQNIEKQGKEIEEIKKNGGNSSSNLFKIGLNDNLEEKEVIKDINLKINDLRKKVNDMENSIKLFLEDNKIDDLDTQVKNIKILLGKKISKDDLKELYNLHLSDVDEINDTNNKILTVYDQVKKNSSDILGNLKKIDNINTNLALLQTYQNSGTSNIPNQPIIDFSKFIDNQKLTDTIKPIIKELEKILQEVYSLRRDVNDLDNLKKDSMKSNVIDKFEEKINEKINDLKVSLNKKYLDKAEHYKAIKNLETLIKVQAEENKKDADSWIMAKQPLKCFNCATCESNIKNVNPSNDYLPWNKYPQGDRIYRMGQGFSHMLQLMTSEFIKNIEKNTSEHQNENEQSHKSLNLNTINDNTIRLNTNSNPNSEKTLFGLSVNNKQQTVFDDSQILQRKSGKIRLPIMNKYNKTKKLKKINDIPVSDEEREKEKEYNEMLDKYKFFGSPRILKIMKKKANEHDNNLSTETNLNPNFGEIRQNLTKSLNFKS